MVYENLSREELKDICAQRGVKEYHNLSKSKLIKLLNSLGESESDLEIQQKVEDLAKELEEEETVAPEPVVEKEKQPKKEKPVKEVKKKIIQLSSQAQHWKNYLAKINISPAMFITKYPNHRYKSFIEEIIEFNNQNNG